MVVNLLGITIHSATDGIWSGIIIGATGGASAGLIIWTIKLLTDWLNKKIDQRKIYIWLKKQPKTSSGKHLVYDLKVIASLNNLTDDRARYICSSDKRIFESLEPNVRDRWGIRN